jgi:hypothetical protein
MKSIIYNPSSPEVAEVLHYAASFYCKTLLPIKHRRVTIHMKFNEDMNSTEAETTWLDSNFIPREFEIKFSRKIKNLKRIVQTCAHEMVHVKQFARGEMYDYLHSNRIRWKTQMFQMNDEQYWDYPWEIEAYGKELGLFVKFKNKFLISDRDLLHNQHLLQHKLKTSNFECDPYAIVSSTLEPLEVCPQPL